MLPFVFFAVLITMLLTSFNINVNSQLAPGQDSILYTELSNVQYPIFSCNIEARHVLATSKNEDNEATTFLTDEDVMTFLNENKDNEAVVAELIDSRTNEYLYLNRGNYLGNFEFELRPDWSPNGVKRFVGMFNDNYFVDLPLYRIIPDFLVQFGLSGTPSVSQKFLQTFEDDPFPKSLTGKDGKTIPFKRGYISFAGSGEANGRTNQFFITYNDEETIGTQTWEVPFARIISGMNTLESIYPLYEEEVDQEQIVIDGEAYLKRNFPQMSYISKCISHGRIAKIEEDTFKVLEFAEPGDVMNPSTVEMVKVTATE